MQFQREKGQRHIAASELARLLRERAPNSSVSARNRMQGTVIAVRKDKIMAQVELICGSFRIVSLMSREAADELDLKPGDLAAAVVKATTVIVERGAGRGAPGG